MAEKNCENCAKEFCAYMPPYGKAYCERWQSNAPAVNRWIPVEDALPENNEIVWVCLYVEKDAFVRKGYFKNEVWYTADGYRMLITPKFWMHEYIPEPPKEDEA